MVDTRSRKSRSPGLKGRLTVKHPNDIVQDEEKPGQHDVVQYADHDLKYESPLPAFYTAPPVSEHIDRNIGALLEAHTALTQGKITKAQYQSIYNDFKNGADVATLAFSKQARKDEAAHNKMLRENRKPRARYTDIPVPKDAEGWNARDTDELVELASMPADQLTAEQKAARRRAQQTLSQRRRRKALQSDRAQDRSM